MDEMLVTATTVDGQEIKVVRKNLEKGVHCYAVIVRNGKVLIVPQWKEDGFIFPGGSVELGENHLDGLVREVKEETGYECKPGRVIDVFTSIYMNFKTGKAQHSILIYYTADIIKGHRTTEGFDEYEKHYAGKARWVTLDEVKEMRFTSNIQQPIRAMIRYLEENMAAK